MGDKGDAVTVRSSDGARAPSLLARAIPIVDWLPHYRRAWLSRDLIAGVTVWAVLIPESIAYASIAGVPVQYGLYTALGAATVFALFTGTRQVIAGPSGPIAAVAASVCTLVVAADSPQYLAAMVGLSAATAIVYLLLGVFRMGWVSNFLASPVLEGFVFAFGLGLIADQLHKILGIAKVEGSYWEKLIGTLKELPQTDPSTLAVGGTAVALLLAHALLRAETPARDHGRHPWHHRRAAVRPDVARRRRRGRLAVGASVPDVADRAQPRSVERAVRRLARRRLRGIQRVHLPP